MDLYKYIGLCRYDMKKVYDKETQGKTEYDFIGLDNNQHKLNEVIFQLNFYINAHI